MKKSYCLHVWGDYACFTRPEMKVERVSYDVMTPSAARAIFEAILWKPAIRWEITQIEVLNPISWISIRRNEVKHKISVSSVKTAMNRGYGQLGLCIEDDRVQRAGLFLRDVAYRIHATFALLPMAGKDDSVPKFAAMFERRAQAGQCFMQPYLGCREFPAFFQLVNSQDTRLTIPTNPVEKDLGWMLYDINYTQESPQPMFFQAYLKQGVLHVPTWDSEDIRQ